MFLVAFVTLALSIVGLFSQIISLQSAKMAAAQTALADNMISVHSAIVGQIEDNPPSSVTTAGCAMAGTVNAVGTSQILNACSDTMTSAALPKGYQPAVFNFASVLYKPSSTALNYVITYATDSTMSTSGYTAHDLLTQLTRRASKNSAYGIVKTSGTLTAISNGALLSYTVPVPPTIPTGAVAMISAAQ